MIVEMQPVLSRPRVVQDALIVVEHVVIADVAPTGIDIVANMVDAEPVIDPASSRRITHLITEARGQAVGQESVDFFPSVVVGEEVRVHDLLDRRLDPSQVDLAGLEAAKQVRAWLEVEPKDGLQPLEGRLHRFVKRAFGVDAVDDIDSSAHVVYCRSFQRMTWSS